MCNAKVDTGSCSWVAWCNRSVIFHKLFFSVVRVRHMKGLLDIPICSVEDQVEARYLLSPPTGQEFGLPFRPKGSTRYSANVNKEFPAVGVGKDVVRYSPHLKQYLTVELMFVCVYVCIQRISLINTATLQIQLHYLCVCVCVCMQTLDSCIPMLTHTHKAQSPNFIICFTWCSTKTVFIRASFPSVHKH